LNGSQLASREPYVIAIMFDAFDWGDRLGVPKDEEWIVELVVE
jgi:hypothetical protein